MSERRYDDEEIQQILSRATRRDGAEPGAGSSDAHPASGLTLAELESIGSEVGIPPARIAEAALALDREDLPSPPTLLGVPRAVAQVTPLMAPLESRVWDRVVADLRSTFRAQGRVSIEGSLRSWRNGNLEVHVEPGAEGWQLRMQSFKGDAGALTGMGFGAMAVGLLVALTAWVGGGEAHQFVVAAFLAAGGAGLIGWTRARLGSWGRERQAQMAQVAERVAALLGGPGSPRPDDGPGES